MNNEQNMQLDWAGKLVDYIREGVRIDGEIRDKLSHGEAAELTRAKFEKQYSLVCSELAKADELRQEVMQERDELCAKLAASQQEAITYKDQWQKAADFADENALFLSKKIAALETVCARIK